MLEEFLIVIEILRTHFIQQASFQIIKFLRKIYIDFMRIDETFGFFPESIHFLTAVCLKFHHGR